MIFFSRYAVYFTPARLKSGRHFDRKIYFRKVCSQYSNIVVHLPCTSRYSGARLWQCIAADSRSACRRSVQRSCPSSCRRERTAGTPRRSPARSRRESCRADRRVWQKTEQYKKLSSCWETLRDAISAGGWKSIGKSLRQVLRRHTAISYAEGANISAGRRVVHCSALLSDRRFPSPPEWQAPLPVEFHNNNAVLENHSGRATRPRKKFDDIFIRLDTIPACARQMGHVATAKTRYAYMRRAVKNQSAANVASVHHQQSRCYERRLCGDPGLTWNNLWKK